MGRSSMNIHAKREEPDLRPFGWAPGDYVFKCTDVDHVSVGEGFKHMPMGDKRCWACRECAMKRYEAARNAPPKVVSDPVKLDTLLKRTPQLLRDKLPARGPFEDVRTVDKATRVALLIAKLHSERRSPTISTTPRNTPTWSKPCSRWRSPLASSGTRSRCI
jgi:hypothetical protein